MNNPLVTVITPCHRAVDIPTVISIFNGQDYPNKELIIVPYGYDVMTEIPPQHDIIVGVSMVFTKMTIGEMRNYACKLAKGEIIVHQDSDDLYSADWITRSVAALGTNDITGLSSAYFYNGTELREFVYAGKQPYVCGATMCYWKKTWERKPFKALSEGEDTLFCSNAGRVVPHDYKEGFCAMIHGSNTASHKQFGKLYKRDIGLLPKFDYI